MRLKIALGVAAAVVLGLGVYLSRPTENAATSRSPDAAVEATAPEALAPPTVEQSAPIEPSRSVREPVEVPIPPTPAAVPRGRIVVVDERGEEHATESGSFLLRMVDPRRDRVQVTVKDGNWSCDLPEGATFSVSMIVLGGRPALAVPFSGPFVATAQMVQLRCEWTTVARLHVVDAISGAELDGVRLYAVDAFEAAGIETMAKRPKQGLVGEDLISPIEIRPVPDEHGSGPPMHFAGRSGYAWGSIQIDPKAGGDFVLKLQPGGDVHAEFEGATRDPRLRLRLYGKSGPDLKWVFECGAEQLERGTPLSLELEGLAVGFYVLRAEIGRQDTAKVLAKAEFAIVAGERATVRLALGELPKPEKIEVVVTLKMDPSWKPEKCNLWLNPLDVDPRSAAADGVLIAGTKWNVVDESTRTSKPILLDAGRYKCQIDALYFGTEVLIGPDPRQQLVLDIPAPARVLVNAVDGESGAPVTGVTFMCAWKGPRDSHFFGGNQGRRETAPGQVEFLAPTGTVRVTVSGPEYSLTDQTLDVLPGVNEMTLKLSLNYRVEFILREGEKVVPWAMSAMNSIRFEPVDRQLRSFKGTSFTEGRLTSVVSTAGVYLATLPKLPGYLPIEPFQVTLTEPGLTKWVVQVVRE